MVNLLTQKLTLVTDALKQAADLGTARNGDLIKTAVGVLYEACLLKYQDDLPDTDPEWQAFVQSTAADVKRCIYSIGAYVAKTTVSFDIEWISEDWRSWRMLCRLLSELAFFTETYQAFLSQKDIAVLGQADVEELVETISGTGDLPSDYIPNDIPESHWWWWYPDTPA